MGSVFVQERETFRKTWDEVRHLLRREVGVRKDSHIVEYSYNGIEEDRHPRILKNETELLYFCTFLYPDPSIHEQRSPGEF